MEELGTRALTDLVELLEKGIEVIPPYLEDLFQRYSLFGIFKEGTFFILSIAAVVLSCYRGYKIIKADDDMSPIGALFIAPIGLGLFGIFIFGAAFFEAMFIPEIYIIHDLQGCTSCG